MIALVRVELLRLRWRRAVLLLLAASVVVPAIIFGAVVYNTRPVTEADLRSAQAQVDQEIASGGYDETLRQCVRHPGRFGVDAGTDAQTACEESVLPRAEFYVYRDVLDLRAERERNTGVAVAVIVTTLMLLLGTTFVGHDWNSGSMSNQLLFEARRSRVWTAKAVTVLGVGFLAALVVLVAYWSGLWAIASARDVAIGPHDVEAAYKQAVLGAALAGAAGLAGYGLTMLLRSTVATLGILFAVAVAGTLLLAAVGLDSHPRIQPQSNVLAYLVGSFTSYDYSQPGCDGSGSTGSAVGAATDCATVISRAASLPYLGVLILLATVPSILSFGRRDVA